MLFALILVIATLAAWAIDRRSAGWRDHARRGLAAAFVVAGLAHLLGPDPFVQHLPEWVPGREAIVYSSGFVEIGLGVALLALRRRRATVGRLVALFLVAVWPANGYVAVTDVAVDGQPGGAYAWIRLPFQVLFIAWAVWSTRAAAADGRAASSSTAPVSRTATPQVPIVR